MPLAWIRFFLLPVLLLTLPGTAALAHGDLSLDEDVCKLKLGPHLIHFTGYQPKQRLGQEFCEDIPLTGQTIMVFDAVDDALRRASIAVRIVENTGSGQQGDQTAPLVASVGPEAFSDGTIALEHEFPDKGDYVGIVTAEMAGSPDAVYVGRFPFSVGVGDGLERQIIQLVLWVGLLGIAVYFLSIRLDQRRASRTRAGPP